MRRAALLWCLFAAGCTVGPDYRAPNAPSGAAAQLREAGIAGVTPSPLPSRWWRLFDDTTLDRLVEKALAHNTDLRQSAAALQRARAVLSEARAGRLPTNELSAQ